MRGYLLAQRQVTSGYGIKKNDLLPLAPQGGVRPHECSVFGRMLMVECSSLVECLWASSCACLW